MIEFLGVIGIFIIACLTFVAGAAYFEGCVSKDFIKAHQEKPYCLSDSATVIDQTVTVKRCFKVVEVK